MPYTWTEDLSIDLARIHASNIQEVRDALDITHNACPAHKVAVESTWYNDYLTTYDNYNPTLYVGNLSSNRVTNQGHDQTYRNIYDAPDNNSEDGSDCSTNNTPYDGGNNNYCLSICSGEYGLNQHDTSRQFGG